VGFNLFFWDAGAGVIEGLLDLRPEPYVVFGI
jgi:hypothetical protein